MNKTSIPEAINWLQRLGYQVSTPPISHEYSWSWAFWIAKN